MPRLSPILTGLCLSLVSLPLLPAQLIPRKPAPAPQTGPAATAPPAAPGPARPLKQEDVDRLLLQLTEIQDDLQGKRSTYNNSLLTQLKEAGNSEEKSYQLWLDGTKEFEFDEKGKTFTEFAEWKRAKTKELHNSPFLTALRLQVRYLSVLILYSNAQTESAKTEAITAAVAYLEDLAGSAKKLDGQMDELNRSVLDSVIAKHLKLDNSLAKVKEGGGGKNDRNDAYRPGNIFEIYDRAIFPYYRDKGQVSALVAAWQKLISQETAMVEAAKVPEKVETFNRERLPVLKWGMAREMYNAGQEDTGMAAMLSLIKANLGNRNAAGWISEMSALLKTKKEQALASTPLAPSPSPAAVPASSVTSPSIPPSPAPAVKTGPAAGKDKAPVLNPFENPEFDPIPLPGDPASAPPAQSSVSPSGKKTSGSGSRAS